MKQGSVLKNEMMQLVGVELPPVVYEVEKGAIRKFAQAIGDSNPLWQDENYAQTSRYRGIIAPPTFVTALRHEGIIELLKTIKYPLKGLLNGSSEIECFQPIRPGDIITVSAKFTNFREHEGKAGKMLFMYYEVTYKNQKGKVVAIGRNMAIRR